MLQSFALQNSTLNFKNIKHENVTHFINVKRWKVNTSGKLLFGYTSWLFEHILNIKYNKLNKFAWFRQNVASLNGINTYETTLFCTFWFYLIFKSVFEVFIANLYMWCCIVNTPIMLVAVKSHFNGSNIPYLFWLISKLFALGNIMFNFASRRWY